MGQIAETTPIHTVRDGRKLLHVASARDIEPFADGRATGLFMRHHEGRLQVVGIKDVDPRKWEGKYESPLFATPGGLRKDFKNEGGDIERFVDTMGQEALEEAGIENLQPKDLHPLCKIIKVDGNLRNVKTDTDEGARGTLEYCVFAHYGDVLLQETDDKDAKEPQWFDVFEHVLNPQKSNWYPSHIAYVLCSLGQLHKITRAYLAREISHPLDVFFFEKFLRTKEARENISKSYEIETYREELLHQLASIDPLGVLEPFYVRRFAKPEECSDENERKRRIWKATQSARNFWSKFMIFPLGAEEYYESEKFFERKNDWREKRP